MNWIVLTVVAMVALLVPTALYATFSTTKDSYSYEHHYTRNGFSQELPCDLDEIGLSEGEMEGQPYQPVADWPTEL